MTEKIKQFDTWLSTAQTGDKYTYFTGNLAHSSWLIDGLSVRQLRRHVMDKCCEWNLDPAPVKATDNRIQFKPHIRLVQKAQKKYWNEKVKDVLTNCDYIAVKL
jgi:hypothetical protein